PVSPSEAASSRRRVMVRSATPGSLLLGCGAPRRLDVRADEGLSTVGKPIGLRFKPVAFLLAPVVVLFEPVVALFESLVALFEAVVVVSKLRLQPLVRALPAVFVQPPQAVGAVAPGA